MKNKRLFLVCGCPGSGKSTWVRQRIANYGGYHISRDEIRFALLDEYGGDYFDHEGEVISTFYSNINALLDNDEIADIYVDATHLTRSARQNVLRKLHLENVYVIAVWFDIPLEICLYRNSLREGRSNVPKKTIEDMFNRFSKPTAYDFDEVWRIDVNGDEHK